MLQIPAAVSSVARSRSGCLAWEEGWSWRLHALCKLPFISQYFNVVQAACWQSVSHDSVDSAHLKVGPARCQNVVQRNGSSGLPETVFLAEWTYEGLAVANPLSPNSTGLRLWVSCVVGRNHKVFIPWGENGWFREKATYIDIFYSSISVEDCLPHRCKIIHQVWNASWDLNAVGAALSHRRVCFNALALN